MRKFVPDSYRDSRLSEFQPYFQSMYAVPPAAPRWPNAVQGSRYPLVVRPAKAKGGHPFLSLTGGGFFWVLVLCSCPIIFMGYRFWINRMEETPTPT
ncbi:MAG: hypothetical protein R2795_21205 [Saprospiraceae bacterium]